MSKFTQTSVDALLRRRPNGRFTASVTKDDRIGGLRLAVGPRRAAWTLSYIPHGKTAAGGRLSRVTMVIADATSISLHEARSRAQELKLQVSRGRDPQRERRSAKSAAIADRDFTALTVDAVVKDYSDVTLARSGATQRYLRQQAVYVAKAVRIMGVGTLPVTALGVKDIRTLLDRVDGSPSERKHIYGAFSRFSRWLRKRDAISVDPCSLVDADERPRSVVKRDYVPTIAQLRTVWRAVESLSDVTSDLIHFLLLMPLRRSEAAGLRWNEVDFTEGWIRIPGPRMKNRQRHELPLAGPALEILVRRRASVPASEKLVFPSQTGASLDDWARVCAHIRGALGQADASRSERFQLHDVRRGFVTHLAEHFDEEALDRILAHSRSGVASVYQHARYMNARPRIMAKWAEILLGQHANDANDAANVVKLRAGAVS
jgi:integrase